jgi:hypothetical protein
MGALRLLAALMRIVGNGCRHLGALAERVYDFPLFLPLWLEVRMQQRRAAELEREAIPEQGVLL